jgi:cytochrome c oxidase cbb3-type subunit 4
MDVNLLRIAVTLVSLILFLGIVRWAWSDRHRADFSDAAFLPLDADRHEARGDDAGSRR